ncbi:uncharacterized protein IL334_007634 [Kwoniella shivajii]|uniref:Uncharacterized protein n=1 Tax=Kwoniella shivajii TaxID=564305 RepID=A0ABZ1DA05_9TREE|nr:hypothetical protein IL334_007634 [Kwoniella shivajii]
MSTQYDLSPMERMMLAKMALLEAEKEERRNKKASKRLERKLSLANSLNSENSIREEPVASTSTYTPSRSGSLARPSSILRKTQQQQLTPKTYSREPISPTSIRKPSIPSSPAPSLPLPPAPIVSSNTDFGPSLDSPFSTALTTNTISRRSSRVRFSDQQLQPNFVPPISMSRSTSLKGLRRESSIDGLRADLDQASTSFTLNRIPSKDSLSRRVSLASIGRNSFASSINSLESDPFDWATSSVGSRPSVSFPLTGSEGDLEITECTERAGFEPQLLPYPKTPPGLSRLSIDTTASSIWSESDSYHLDDQTLQDTLGRSSLRSSLSINMTNKYDQTRQPSNPFALEAKIESCDSDVGHDGNSRKSSYTPSSLISSSLNSSSSEHELNQNISITPSSGGIGSTNSSISFHLLPRAQTIAYSSLLPRRRSSLLSQTQAHTMDHLPNLNRGEWDDPELGLSPRSGPVRLGSLSVSVSGSRRSTKLSEEITQYCSSPEVEQKEQNQEDVLQRNKSLDDIDSLPLPPQDEEHDTPKKSHNRSESTLSSIMFFPIPPNRIIDTEASTPESGSESESGFDRIVNNEEETLPMLTKEEHPQEEEDTVNEQIIHLPLETAIRIPHNEEVDVFFQHHDPVVSLNSPFTDSVPCTIIPQPIEIISPEMQGIKVLDGSEERVPYPSSPEIGQHLSSVPRPRRNRSYLADLDLDTEESDLDISSPLVKVALDSRILTPRSRLVSASPSPKVIRPAYMRSISANSATSTTSLRSGVSLTSGKGWSGSESEEEDWINTVRSIKLRKASRGTSVSSSIPFGEKKQNPNGLTIQIQSNDDEEEDVVPTTTKRLSISSITTTCSNKSGSRRESLKRFSQLSEISTVESHLPLTPLTLEILTPSTIISLSRKNSNTSSNGSSQPGNFPWGLSSPPNSPIRGLFMNNPLPSKEFLTSFRTKSKSKSNSTQRSGKELPEPTRIENGWGEPEILIDQHDSQESEFLLTDDNDECGSRYNSLRGSVSSLSMKSDISIPENTYDRKSTLVLSLGGEDLTPTKQYKERCDSPEMWMDAEGERSLMDEEMPED